MGDNERQREECGSTGLLAGLMARVMVGLILGLSGQLTPASFSPSNACGLVTSCTKCLSIYSSVLPSISVTV